MLISTGAIRDWLSLQADDTKVNAKLETLIYAIEDFCDDYVGYPLEAAVYRTNVNYCYLDGKGEPYIYVPVFPLSSVAAINIDSDRDFGDNTDLAADDFFFSPDGKIRSEAGWFTRGWRNVLVDYTAGYAPIVGGTHDAEVSSYPLPRALEQTMVEMTANAYQRGVTKIHAVEGQQEDRFVKMMTDQSFWKVTLNKYKDFTTGLQMRGE